MKKTTAILLCAVALIGAACVSPVPANETMIGDIKLRTPHDMEITGFHFKRESRYKYSLDADRWSSINNPSVVQQSADGQAKIIEATGNVAAKVGAAVVEGAVKGAK